MAPVKGADAEKAPLLTSSGYIAVAADEAQAASAGTPEVPTRQWNGSLLACCGSCDFIGVGSCLLSKYLPCVAFGHNAKRAFKQSAWLHGLTYLALFMVVGWLSVMFLASANHNVLAQCNGDLPGPRDNFWMQLGRDRGSDSFEFDWDSDALSFRGLGENDDDDNDHHHHHDDKAGDHHDHKHDHGHKDGDKHGKKPCKGKKGKSKDRDAAAAAAVASNPESLTSNNVNVLDKADTQAAVAGLVSKPSETFKTVGDFATRKMGPAFADEGPDHKRSQEQLLASPECREAVMVYCSAWLALAVSMLLAVMYAARRRSMLRERFGIAGSKLGDFCTWCWCAPCALCQETRTLWTNNVEEGVWHGADSYAPIATPATVPQSQFMTV